MILKQFYLNCLAHASYLVGDETAGTAAVVDPQRDVDQYLAFAADHHLQIKYVFLTSIYFSDPSNNPLEIATLDLADPAWKDYDFTEWLQDDELYPALIDEEH